MAEVEATGASVEVGTGDEIVLRLTENGSTGYVWSVRALGDGLELVGDTWVSPTSGAPGASGERVLRLRAVRPTTAEVVLVLGRPWEDEPVDERRLDVTVRAHQR